MMRNKEHQLQKLIELKYQRAQALVTDAKTACLKIDDQIAHLQERRNARPTDPSDQINHERHIGWLDHRNRELTIMAAKAAADYNIAKDMLRLEFGRKTAWSKSVEKQTHEISKRVSRQLS